MTEQPVVRSLSGRQNQQLALAVNLMNSKPASLSVKGRSGLKLCFRSCSSDISTDYIHNLRQSLASNPAMDTSSELKALRNEVRQLRGENKDLREENKNLRQQFQAISAQGGSSRPNTKRKRSLTDILATPIEPGAAFVLEDLEIYLPSAEG